MAYTRPTLEKMLQSSGCWTVDPEGLFIVGILDDNFDERDCIYTSEDFAQLHPLLPNAIKALSNWVWENANTSYVYDYHINATLAYLRLGAVKLRTSMGNEWHVFSIAKFHEDPALQAVVIDCQCANVVAQTIEGQHVSFVTHMERYDLELEKEDLDQQYPGALTRWGIALALGLAGQDLLQYAFTPSSTAAALPGDISFP